MKIGLISDTHGNMQALSQAIRLFHEKTIQLLIHTGDVTRPRHLKPLLEAGWPVQLAIGNMDSPAENFQHLTTIYNLTLHTISGTIKINNHQLGITHGHLDSALRLLQKDNFDLIIHGHTHERRDQQINGTRIINPGAATSPGNSCAILDLNSNHLSFYSL